MRKHASRRGYPDIGSIPDRAPYAILEQNFPTGDELEPLRTPRSTFRGSHQEPQNPKRRFAPTPGHSTRARRQLACGSCRRRGKRSPAFLSPSPSRVFLRALDVALTGAAHRPHRPNYYDAINSYERRTPKDQSSLRSDQLPEPCSDRPERLFRCAGIRRNRGNSHRCPPTVFIGPPVLLVRETTGIPKVARW